jgi:pyruvate dehydrogenase E1 component alpha subunit
MKTKDISSETISFRCRDTELISTESIWSMYRDALLMRRLEERVMQLYREKFIAGFCHPYIGQEAVLVGAKQVMKHGLDTCITSYRCHAHMLAFGATARSVMAELTGRVTGCSRGKGGSMHMFHTEGGFYGGHGIVGAYVSLGTGLALTQKYKKLGGVAVTFLGDGASNNGQTFESFNMASLWKLPVVYIIENNGYAIGTSCARSCASTDLYKRGEPFGIPGVQADGMDPFDIIEKVSWALDHARTGNGPAIVEALTYRYKGHSVSDPATYRSKEEVDSMKERDPLLILEQHLRDRSCYSDERKNQISKEVMAEVMDAVDFAKTSPEPDEREVWEGVYGDNSIRSNL